MTAGRLCVLVAVPLLFAPAGAAALDLTGKWRFETNSSPPYVERVQVTQTGNTLSFTYGGHAFSGSVSPAGSFTNYTVSASTPTQAGMGGRVMPSGNLLDGRLVVAFPPDPYPFVGGVVGTRCTCDDGNTANGDGCDAACQIEPCWTCAGDPSICSPAADGSACEDGSVCTVGEACAGGACVGGAPVSPPCTDMTGRWNQHAETTAPGPPTYDFASDVSQRGSDLVFRDAGSGRATLVGTIDPTTGGFDLRSVNPDFFCDPFDPLTGSVAATGETFAAAGTTEVPFPSIGDQCGTYPLTETGTRCGSGTIDPTEECDDGNLKDGDGCSATCHVEQCWSCTGEPSTCSPLTGPACDDGDPCTTGDACTSAGKCTGTAIACGPCLACEGGGCVAIPRAPCKASSHPDRSLLSARNVGNDVEDVLAWTWKSGAATTLQELGNPPTGDGFVFCVYDESGPSTGLLFRAAVPGGGTCDGGPCWTPKGGAGFAYRDTLASPDGVLSAHVRSGEAASALIRARGVHLSDRPFGLPAPPLPTPLRVQLQGDAGFCAETRYGATGVLKNDPVRGGFKARGGP